MRNRLRKVRYSLHRVYHDTQPRHPWVMRSFNHEKLIGWFSTHRKKSYVDLDNPKFLR